MTILEEEVEKFLRVRDKVELEKKMISFKHDKSVANINSQCQIRQHFIMKGNGVQ